MWLKNGRETHTHHMYAAIQNDGIEFCQSTIGGAQLFTGHNFYCSLALQVGIYLYWRPVSYTISSITRKRINKNAH